jgi:periplasmic copper chaperone A
MSVRHALRSLAVGAGGALVMISSAMPASAQSPAVSIREAWVRRAPLLAGDTGSMRMGDGATAAAYVTIHNRSRASDELLSVTSDAADRVEVHETRWMSGMAMMEPVPRLSVAPRATVAMKPGGIHLMLVGLRRSLDPGGRVTLELVFRQAGAMTVRAEIR